MAVGKISYAGFYKQTYKLVTLTLCIVTSEITETVGGVAKTGLQILAEIRSGELITQMAVTGTGPETTPTCKQCLMNILRLTKICVVLQDGWFSWLNVGVGFQQWRKWFIDFS